MMNPIRCLPEGKWPLLLSTCALILTFCSLVAISISLETAYMWLVVVIMTILFLTTFTCSSSKPQIQETEGQVPNFNESPRPQPYWLVDLPPAYSLATGYPSGATPPPSYATIHPPPKYNSVKLDIEGQITNPLESCRRGIENHLNYNIARIHNCGIPNPRIHHDSTTSSHSV